MHNFCLVANPLKAFMCVCWNNICKIHSMYIAEDCCDFLAKKQSWIGGLELVTFLRIPHQARKVEMIPFGS